MPSADLILPSVLDPYSIARTWTPARGLASLVGAVGISQIQLSFITMGAARVIYDNYSRVTELAKALTSQNSCSSFPAPEGSFSSVG
jgi:hypothetical protein